MTEVILASKSPRRQELLRNLVHHFIVVNAEVNEAAHNLENPQEYVLRLAREKALGAAKMISSGDLTDAAIIAADTIVLDGSEILGKPRDRQDAARMLEQLRGKPHLVLSAIAVYHLPTAELSSRLVSSWVQMRNFTPDEIREYIKSGDPFDKAGAYAIQNETFQPVEDFKECFANVMGLPLCDLYVLMNNAGLQGDQMVAENCQSAIAYQCPVYKERLLS